MRTFWLIRAITSLIFRLCVPKADLHTPALKDGARFIQVASYAIDPDGKIGITASRVIDAAVREDLADALRAIADGSEAPTTPHGWLTLEGFADKPGSDVDFAFDTVGYGTVINVEHTNAGEDDVAAIRSACALLAGALELSLDQD